MVFRISDSNADILQILMLSGVGPAEQLQKHGIEVVQNNHYIGKGLRDHIGLAMTYLRKEGTNDRREFYSNQKAVADAKAQWMKDQTGPLSEFGCVLGTGFFKSDKIYESEEFKALDGQTQRHLRLPTVPLYEIITVSLLCNIADLANLTKSRMLLILQESTRRSLLQPFMYSL